MAGSDANSWSICYRDNVMQVLSNKGLNRSSAGLSFSIVQKSSAFGVQKAGFKSYLEGLRFNHIWRDHLCNGKCCMIAHIWKYVTWGTTCGVRLTEFSQIDRSFCLAPREDTVLTAKLFLLLRILKVLLKVVGHFIFYKLKFVILRERLSLS